MRNKNRCKIAIREVDGEALSWFCKLYEFRGFVESRPGGEDGGAEQEATTERSREYNKFRSSAANG